MRTLFAAAAALVMVATPATAQQSQPGNAAPARQEAAPVRAPSLYVCPDEVRERVRASEAALAEAQAGSQSWWYLVAAIAVGVLIAALVL
jgi:hypothetical protein